MTQLIFDYIEHIDGLKPDKDALVYEEDLLIQDPTDTNKIISTYALYSLLLDNKKTYYAVIESSTAATVIKPDNGFMKEYFPSYLENV